MRTMLRSLTFAAIAAFLALPAPLAAQTNSTVSVRLLDTLTTGSSQRGDTFSGTLAAPLVWQGRVVARKGDPVTGQVTQVVTPGWFSRSALITLRLQNAQSRSGSFPVQTGDLTIKTDSPAKRTLLIIGGTTAAGAAIGGAASGGKGAAIGAAAGAGAGSLGAYLTGKQEIVIPAETLLTFHVSSVTISTKELGVLQRAAPPDQRVYDPGEPYPVVEHRHYHVHEGDDAEYEYEDEYGHHEHGYPPRIDVIFISNHRARVGLCWPDRTEYVYVHGDDLDEILEPLSNQLHISVAVIRPRMRILREYEYEREHDD